MLLMNRFLRFPRQRRNIDLLRLIFLRHGGAQERKAQCGEHSEADVKISNAKYVFHGSFHGEHCRRF